MYYYILMMGTKIQFVSHLLDYLALGMKRQQVAALLLDCNLFSVPNPTTNTTIYFSLF